MSPEYVLILCLAGLGLTVAYAWWSVIRPTLLRADLQALRVELDSKMRAQGMMDDPGYLQTRLLITRLIDSAPELSVPVFYLSGYLMGARRSDEGGVEAGEGKYHLLQFEGLPPDVRRAKMLVLVYALLHVGLSPGTWLILLPLAAFGKTKALASFLASQQAPPRGAGKLVPQRP